ncbi:NERD domain-containing protein [Sporosarcina sp. ITBMC105]
MAFIKKPFLSRVVDALKDKEELKLPVVIKEADSMDSEIARLQQALAEGQLNDTEAKKLTKQMKFLEIGKSGEQSLLFELKNSFLPIMILHDVQIEHKGLTAQFDFIVITRQFFLVIEVKKYYGNITVNEKGEFIRTVNRGGRTIFQEGMYSPIRQVERQVDVLRAMLMDHGVIERTPIRYVVAFANEKTVLNIKKAPPEVKNQVFRSDGIVSFLKAELAKKSPVYFRDNRMREFAEYIKDQHLSNRAIEKQEETEVRYFTEEADQEIQPAVGIEKAITRDELEAALKAFRKQLAEKTGQKAFYIFTNKTLDELIEKRPQTLEELRQIYGLGDKKIHEFGEELVRVVSGEVVLIS